MILERHFIKKLAYFFLLLIVQLSFLEFLARLMYTSRTDLYFKHSSIVNQLSQIHVLILGASHGEKSLNPQFFREKTFNLSYSSQDVYYDYQIIEKYIDRLPSLQTVILTLSWFSFGYDEETYEPFFAKDYYHELGISPRSQNILRTWLYSSLFYTHHYGLIKDLILKKRPVLHRIDTCSAVSENSNLPDEVLIANGYRYNNTYMPSSQLLRHGQLKAENHQSLYNRDLINENMTYYQKIITLLLARKKNIVLITPPYSKAYRSSFNSSYLNEFYTLITQLKKQFPQIEYYDFSNWKLTDDCFWDSDHLNITGAEKFSKHLDSLLFNSR